MLIALTSFSCLKVYSCVKTENKEITQAATQDVDVDYSKLSSSEVYTIPDQENDSEGNPTDTKIIENYDNYTYFKILGYQSIRQFGHSLSKKHDFSGKVIFLSSDISYANGLWRPIGLL